MLAASIRATPLALSGSSLAASTLASNFVKRPVTVANMAGCLTLNSTLEWAGSADQVPAGTMVLPASGSGSTTTVSPRRVRKLDLAANQRNRKSAQLTAFAHPQDLDRVCAPHAPAS